jgi:hypothetical protein
MNSMQHDYYSYHLQILLHNVFTHSQAELRHTAKASETAALGAEVNRLQVALSGYSTRDETEQVSIFDRYCILLIHLYVELLRTIRSPSCLKNSKET